MHFVIVLTADTGQNLSNINPGGNTNGFSVRMTHATRKPIRTGTTQHLVGAENVVGVGADANVVTVFANVLDQMLVDSHAAGFEGFRRDLLLLVADQVEARQVTR